MATLYESVDRFIFVPIIRERLTFAVIVQRLNRLLNFGPGDIFAVEMPEKSVGNRLDSTWANNPNAFMDVRLIMTRERDMNGALSGPREVFAVTPCDAVIEALRIAKAKGIDVEYIDAEIRPSTLLQRDCQSLDDLPDDWWAITEGVDWYFKQALPLLSKASDPAVDGRRETYMARRLRKLADENPNRRIIVVCSAVHVEGIKNCLDLPAEGEVFEHDLPVVSTQPELARPHTARLYLDDLPKVTEAYELSRQNGCAADFDKPLETRRAVALALSLNGQATVSTREMETFIRVLDRESFGRLSPRMRELDRIAEMCFDSPAGVHANLRTALLEYGSQVSAASLDAEPQRRAIQGQGAYVLRMCGTWKDNWQPRLPKPSPDDDWKAWPPWKMHANEMRRQALQSASFRRYSRPEAFRGSLEDGIHIRQTIRGLHGFPPVVYVRKSHRLREAVDLRGPVVWLFSDTEDKMEAGEIWFGLVERWDRRFVGAEFFQIGAAVPIPSVPSIQLRRLAGLISYCDIGLEIGRVEEALGPAFHRRVPKSLAKVQLNFSLPWWQSLAIRAAQFADRHVIRIAMPEFSKVGEFDQKVREAGKEVVAVAPDFDSAHVRKLREMYWVARSPSPPRGSDTNKQQYEQDVGATYAAYLSQEITAADWRLY